MAFCSKCGNEMQEGAKFCDKCGASFATGEKVNDTFDAIKDKFENLNNTADTTKEFDAADINDNKVMAILAYISILFLVPLLAAKDSKFAKFHTNQGLVLFIISFAWAIISGMLSAVFLFVPLFNVVVAIIGWLVSLVLVAFMIIGIVNAATGKAKELPLIGSIKIIK